MPDTTLLELARDILRDEDTEFRFDMGTILKFDEYGEKPRGCIVGLMMWLENFKLPARFRWQDIIEWAHEKTGLPRDGLFQLFYPPYPANILRQRISDTDAADAIDAFLNNQDPKQFWINLLGEEECLQSA